MGSFRVSIRQGSASGTRRESEKILFIYPFGSWILTQAIPGSGFRERHLEGNVFQAFSFVRIPKCFDGLLPIAILVPTVKESTATGRNG